jgi:hypothetical protein
VTDISWIHEMTVFPKGKHDDQIESTERNFSTTTEGELGDLSSPPSATGIGAVQTVAGQHSQMHPDGTFEKPARDAELQL